MKKVLALLMLLYFAGAAQVAMAAVPTALQATVSIFEQDKRMVAEKIVEVRNAVWDPKEGKEGFEARIKALNDQLGWKITSAGNGELRFQSGNVYSMRNWEPLTATGATPDGVVITSYFEPAPPGKVRFDDGNGHFIVMQLSASEVQVEDADLPFLPKDFTQRLFLLLKTRDKREMAKNLTDYFRAGVNRTDTNFYELAVHLLKTPAQRNDFLEWLALNVPTLPAVEPPVPDPAK